MAVYALAVNHFVAVMREEIAHIIEVTVATVQKLTTVSYARQHAAHRQLPHTVFASLDDTFTRTGRNAERQCLQAAHRTVAGSVKTVENHAFFHQFVETRSNVFLVAIARKEVGTKAFNRYQNHVGAGGYRTAAEHFLPLRIEPCLMMIQGYGLFLRQKRIETVILELVFVERYAKITCPVLLKLCHILVVRGQRQHAPQHAPRA